MTSPSRSRSATRHTQSRVWRVAVWVVMLGLVAVLVAAVVVPRAAGATPYTVLTGSMAPAYPPGTVVVARPVPFDDISVGDVITYQIRSGEPEVVTHRVVAVGSTLGGVSERTLTTQGDANDVPDQDPVSAEQVRGRIWYSIPVVGHLTSQITPDRREVAMSAAVGGLFLYAGYMFVTAARDSRRRRDSADTSSRTDTVEVPR